jgi:hypothetical protein
MKLRELEPQFLKITTETSWSHVDSIAEADGIIFLCPVCFKTNNGPIGTHSIICWTPKVPLTITPGPGRWNLVGTSYDDLTLTAGSSSIHLTGEGCGAHFYIQGGEIKSA